jgi:surfeit locus 1 family protein
MPSRMILFAAIALAAAALFVRLGFWQLDRLRQRQERNRLITSRLALPPAQWSDTGAVRYRRVVLDGAFDYANEIVLVGRSRAGSPGVNLVTPLKRPGNDTAILVNRGWVYSPDAANVNGTRWHEGDARHVIEGYVEEFNSPGPGDLPAQQRVARRLSYAAAQARFPYPIAPAYVVALNTAKTPRPDAPARLPLPTPDNGPHLGYALQWFAFALIAVVGAGIALATGRRERKAARQVAISPGHGV